ncbi:MAG: LCP family protein [Solirubrobacteraceae bacterium]|nr:LCP family protein [Solirubrobacteraceae bacterium]
MTNPGKGPSASWSVLKRFLLGGFVIVAVTSGAVASAVLLEVKDAANAFERFQTPLTGDVEGALDDVDPGKPQTIMLLGSDQRFADIKQKNPSRSDTIILVRLDPEKDATAVMSLPRDLKVEIPTKNGIVSDKINAAYSIGGPSMTVKTVRRLLGIPIHHVVNVNFGGFRRIVNRLGCFYQDVDRTYFNDNQPPNGSAYPYATIDVKAGYQLMCGQDSLDWARYRHFDDDFVRAARQQEFIRQAKEQVSVSSIFGDRDELLEIFGRYTQTDIKGQNAILRLLKLAYESSKSPIREVRFRAGQNDGDTFVTITPDNLQKTVREFEAVKASTGGRQTREGGSTGGGTRKQSRQKKKGLAPGLIQDKVGGENHALDLAVKAGFPVYYPKARLNRGGYVSDSPRRYTLKTRNGRKYAAYRITLKYGNDIGQYYGVQGLKWRNPPILDEAHDKQKLRGRTYRVYYDGNRIRMVAWKTPTGSYWVSNTLSQRLTNRQMLDIAKYLTRVGL